MAKGGAGVDRVLSRVRGVDGNLLYFALGVDDPINDAILSSPRFSAIVVNEMRWTMTERNGITRTIPVLSRMRWKK